MADVGTLSSLVQGGAGALAALAFIVVALIRGWLVPGMIYQDLKQERDYWRSVADRALTAAEKVVPVLTRVSGGGS